MDEGAGFANGRPRFVPHPPLKEWALGGDRKKNMFDIKRKTIDWAGRPLTLETGRIARQADGAVLATYGETVVLATVVAARSAKPGVDFFPLTVNYQEKTFAAEEGGFDLTHILDVEGDRVLVSHHAAGVHAQGLAWG